MNATTARHSARVALLTLLLVVGLLPVSQALWTPQLSAQEPERDRVNLDVEDAGADAGANAPGADWLEHYLKDIEEAAIEEAEAARDAQQQRAAQSNSRAMTRAQRRVYRNAPGDLTQDARGRWFRTSFPLYDRFWLEASSGVRTGQQGEPGSGVEAPALRMPMTGRLRLERGLALDYSDESVWWMLRHALLDTRVRTAGTGKGLDVESTLLEGRYLRHDLNAFVVIPSANDLRIPANFDIAVDYTLMRLRANYQPTDATRGWTVSRVEAVELAFMADLIRDETYRHRFAVGLSSWYLAERGGSDTPWRHELSPLAAGKVLYGWDHPRGLSRIYSEVVCGGALSVVGDVSTETGWQGRCRGLFLAEWTPMAISDHPLSIPLEVRADMPLADARALTLEATLGVRLSFARR